MKRPCTFHPHCLSLEELIKINSEKVVFEFFFKMFRRVAPSSVEDKTNEELRMTLRLDMVCLRL